MERFLLDNVALYQTLVKRFKPSPAVSYTRGGESTETPSPDIVVSVRIRPLLDEGLTSGFPCAVFPRADETGVVDVHDLYHHPRGRPILKSFNYQVDRLFGPEATTREIYDRQVEDLVSFAWNGGIGTLFAYGQTGSGKTTTISGLEQLTVTSLMRRGEGKSDRRKVYMTIIELAGNLAYDLLSSRKPISILEDSFGVTQLVGAEEHLLVQEGGDDSAAGLIERAASFRRTAPTLKNDVSSRTHSICLLRISTPDQPSGGSHGTSDGFLYLIDLAGSEAARDVASHGADRMRETREINISLSVLKDCIRGKAQADALASSASQGPNSQRQKKPPHVPFRQSTLTKVLKHVFDPVATAGKTKTVVVACVNPSLADVGPSKNTLRYAEMLRVSVPLSVKTKATGSSSNSEGEINSMVVGMAPPLVTSRPSSRDPDPAAVALPWRKRIRPGMVISWNPSSPSNDSGAIGILDTSKQQLAVVLCPEDAVGSRQPVNEAHRNVIRPQGGHNGYLCAQVMPGAVSGTYEVNLWQQVIVDVETMEKEVILEYDGTRYYHIAG
ncbi:P-loop containing nucleoside triphosphate hydrolase protein [Pseudomassariella vexata]|uniref:p-loop containing nucleoside triphosphate hydrolase protein n=1 Tax=Pseudomassariella vexata TaxID=1141098 RepID=A0A1Y2EBX7_9PEZI|nr:P-loop containing nucleoside triphosphate hydrolase protein [Pseudomassariella vexata]ORY69061.1 P-loop containing nucleoside triphosphate hydrolase protein [Pseudomassariella vexata]